MRCGTPKSTVEGRSGSTRERVDILTRSGSEEGPATETSSARGPRWRVLMLRIFAPVRARQISPGQRPGGRRERRTGQRFKPGASPVRALQSGRAGDIGTAGGKLRKRLFRPYRAASCMVHVSIPGRCPGLYCGCPVRGGNETAQHQNWRVGLVRFWALPVPSPRGLASVATSRPADGK